MKGLDTRDTHFYLSILKSSIRIFGCGIAAVNGSVLVLAASLLFAEVVGILEELDF